MSDYPLLLEESSTWIGSVELDIEALVREAYEIVEAQIEAEEGSTMKTGPRGSEDAEEEASLHTADGAYAEAVRAYDGDMREGARRATLSSCGEGTTMDEAGIYGAMDTTSRVGVSFGTWLPDSFYEDFASILEACEIEDEVATDNDVQEEVATGTTSGAAATLHTPVLESLTSAIDITVGVRPRVTNSGGGKAGNRKTGGKDCMRRWP